jgi:ABC-type nitrate/sulfonate/bicarbonate transport system permease component
VAPGDDAVSARARSADTWLPVAGIAAFLVIWQLVGSAEAATISRPSRVVVELVDLIRHDGLLRLAGNTITILVLGFAVSTVVGVILGFLLGQVRWLRVLLEPYLTALYATPRIAYVPLLVIWFGIGKSFLFVAVVLSAAVMLVFPTISGVQEADRQFGQLGRSLCIGRARYFARVLLPGALPFVLTGMRLSIQRALMTVIVAEFLVGYPGLGDALKTARVTLDVDKVLAIALMCLLVGAALTGVISLIDRRAFAWRSR